LHGARRTAIIGSTNDRHQPTAGDPVTRRIYRQLAHQVREVTRAEDRRIALSIDDV
jgi:hypothetical protein